MRAPVAAVVATFLPACSLLGFYDEAPTECPDDIACCSTRDPLAHGGCDWTCNDPEAPDFRLAALRFEPDAPVSTLFRNALEGAVEAGGLVWLVDLEAGGADVTYLFGSGTCDPDGACALASDPPPAAGGALVAQDGRIALPSPGRFDVTLRLSSPELGDDVRLPLRDCSFGGPVERQANCMGRRLSTSPGDWSTPAQLSCVISANEATTFLVPVPNQTLCDVLAGCGALDCCEEPRVGWLNQPDATFAGFPAWSVRADAAAIGVRIGE